MNEIDSRLKSVHVSPAKGGKAPIFRGDGGEIHTRVAEEMAAILAETEEPKYLLSGGKFLLKAARESALRSGVLSKGGIVRKNSIQWFPWLGTRGLLTLELHAHCDGIATTRDELSITYKEVSPSRLLAHLKTIQQDRRSALDLAQKMTKKVYDKFDEMLTEELLDEANARDRLDLAGAKSRAENLIDIGGLT